MKFWNIPPAAQKEVDRQQSKYSNWILAAGSPF